MKVKVGKWNPENKLVINYCVDKKKFCFFMAQLTFLLINTNDTFILYKYDCDVFMMSLRRLFIIMPINANQG